MFLIAKYVICLSREYLIKKDELELEVFIESINVRRMLINQQASWWNQEEEGISWEAWNWFSTLSARKYMAAQDKFAYYDYEICWATEAQYH